MNNVLTHSFFFSFDYTLHSLYSLCHEVCVTCLTDTDSLLSHGVNYKVLITVLDVNDCRPQFSKSQFSTSVYENEPEGTSVITMSATDLDEGDNGIVTYNLEGPGAGML